MAIKNLGHAAAMPFSPAAGRPDVSAASTQFCEQVDVGTVNKRIIESLIKAGAMDTLEGSRAQKFLAVDGALESGQRAWRDRQSGRPDCSAMCLAPKNRPNAPAARARVARPRSAPG